MPAAPTGRLQCRSEAARGRSRSGSAAKQTFGTIGGGNKPKDCSKGQGCTGTFDISSRRSAPPTTTTGSNSGNIDLVQIADGNGNFANSLIQGTQHDFTITVRIKGLENSKPTDPPIVLRNSNQDSKRTGLVDCGQGNGANADHDAIVNGCPLGVYIYPEGTQCVVPDSDPIDCVTAIPGNRSAEDRERRQRPDQRRLQPLERIPRQRLVRHQQLHHAGRPAAAAADHHETGGPVGKLQRRPIPVRAIATFYVTGYDGGSGNGQGCANEKYPGKGSEKFQIWGHWIKYVPVGGGVGDGKGCDATTFGDCIAVLTQ